MKQCETVTDTDTFGFQLSLHHPLLHYPPKVLHQLGIFYTSSACTACNFFHLCHQASMQMLAIVVTIGIAMIGGLVTGQEKLQILAPVDLGQCHCI